MSMDSFMHDYRDSVDYRFARAPRIVFTALVNEPMYDGVTLYAPIAYRARLENAIADANTWADIIRAAKRQPGERAEPGYIDAHVLEDGTVEMDAPPAPQGPPYSTLWGIPVYTSRVVDPGEFRIEDGPAMRLHNWSIR